MIIVRFLISLMILTFSMESYPNDSGNAVEIDLSIPLMADDHPEDTLPEEVSVLFAGDTHFEWDVRHMQKKHGIHYPVQDIRELFQNFDLRVLNLETTISLRGSALNSKSYIFNAHPDSIALLSYLGIDIAGIGNNHIMDMGPDAMADTIMHLRNSGIASIGAGGDSEEALSTYITEVKGITFGFISCTNTGPEIQYARTGTPGVMSCGNNIYRKLAELKKAVDHPIVLMHWGVEYSPLPDPIQIDLARNFIKYGATAVIGHHPHIPQGIELRGGGVIAHSLGNFLFGSIQSEQRDNMLLSLHFNRRSKALHLLRIYPINGDYRKRGNRVFQIGQDAEGFWKSLYVQSSMLNSVKPEIRVLPDGTGEWIIARD